MPPCRFRETALADKGRVSLDPTAPEWLRQVFRTIPFKEAPLTHEIALHSRSVLLTHEDPVDRFLARLSTT